MANIILGFHFEGMANSFLTEIVLSENIRSSCSLELVDGTSDIPVEL